MISEHIASGNDVAPDEISEWSPARRPPLTSIVLPFMFIRASQIPMPLDKAAIVTTAYTRHQARVLRDALAVNISTGQLFVKLLN